MFCPFCLSCCMLLIVSVVSHISRDRHIATGAFGTEVPYFGVVWTINRVICGNTVVKIQFGSGLIRAARRKPREMVEIACIKPG